MKTTDGKEVSLSEMVEVITDAYHLRRTDDSVCMDVEWRDKTDEHDAKARVTIDRCDGREEEVVVSHQWTKEDIERIWEIVESPVRLDTNFIQVNVNEGDVSLDIESVSISNNDYRSVRIRPREDDLNTSVMHRRIVNDYKDKFVEKLEEPCGSFEVSRYQDDGGNWYLIVDNSGCDREKILDWIYEREEKCCLDEDDELDS